MRRWLMRILIGLWTVSVAATAMVLVSWVPARDAVDAVYPATLGRTSAIHAVVEEAPRPRHDPKRPTAVVVLGSEGANVADALAPYEVLAESQAFNVVTAAPERRPIPLTGGLDLVPDYSFAELDGRFPDGVDVVIVPQLPGARTAPVREWLSQQAEAGATLMGVCVGTELLAHEGLLDGRPATSHWLGLYGLTREYPEVPWQRDVRYVDDGNIITTAGVLSGIDGALRLVERYADEGVARRTADAVGWPRYRAGAAAPSAGSRIRPADAVALLNVGRFSPSVMGVLLTDGVGEIEVASALRPYTELTYVARPRILTVDGSPIRSRHGLTFVPRYTLEGVADRLDRLVVPGAQASAEHGSAVSHAAKVVGLKPTYLHSGGEFPFDAVLRDVAGTYDVATATWVAKALEYPVQTDLSGSAWPWARTGMLLLAGLLGAAAALVVVRALRGYPSLRRFAVHYAEMLLAMFAGMVLLGGLWMSLWPGLHDHAPPSTLVMVANMTIGMAAWMAVRRHSRRLILEMSIAMVAPFLLLLVPLATGTISAGTHSTVGHLLMLLTMLAALLLRTGHYAADHRAPTEVGLEEPDGQNSELPVHAGTGAQTGW